MQKLHVKFHPSTHATLVASQLKWNLELLQYLCWTVTLQETLVSQYCSNLG